MREPVIVIDASEQERDRWSKAALLAAYGDEPLSQRGLKAHGSGAPLGALLASAPGRKLSLSQLVALPARRQHSNLFGSPPAGSPLGSLLPPLGARPGAAANDTLPPALRAIASILPIVGAESALSLGLALQYNDAHRHMTAAFSQALYVCVCLCVCRSGVAAPHLAAQTLRLPRTFLEPSSNLPRNLGAQTLRLLRTFLAPSSNLPRTFLR